MTPSSIPAGDDLCANGKICRNVYLASALTARYTYFI